MSKRVEREGRAEEMQKGLPCFSDIGKVCSKMIRWYKEIGSGGIKTHQEDEDEAG